jgi:hypothetical protein
MAPSSCLLNSVQLALPFHTLSPPQLHPHCSSTIYKIFGVGHAAHLELQPTDGHLEEFAQI